MKKEDKAEAVGARSCSDTMKNYKKANRNQDNLDFRNRSFEKLLEEARRRRGNVCF